MRKGIVATILLFSLLQTLVYAIFFGAVRFSDFKGIADFDKTEHVILLCTTYCLLSSSIIVFLGFHLNKKYKLLLTYKKFIAIGIPISILASLINYLIHPLLRLTVNFDENVLSLYQESLYLILVFSIIFYIETLLIAIFHKRYKRTTNKESLDSDLIDNE